MSLVISKYLNLIYIAKITAQQKHKYQHNPRGLINERISGYNQ